MTVDSGIVIKLLAKNAVPCWYIQYVNVPVTGTEKISVVFEDTVQYTDGTVAKKFT